jgi:hypothetical protein
MNNIPFCGLTPCVDRVTGITVQIVTEYFDYLSRILLASGTGKKLKVDVYRTWVILSP